MLCPLCDIEVQVIGGKIAPHGDCRGGFSRVELVETKLESRYTDPRPDCPHPERWTSDDWDSCEHEVSELIAALVAAVRPDIVVETGSAFGQTSYAIGTVLAGAGVGTLHAVEIDPERADITRKRCEGLPVVVEQCSSLEYMPPEGVGFGWFDSLPGLRVEEFRRYHPAFEKGAIVAFHDTAPHHGAQLWTDIEAMDGELLIPIQLRTPRGIVIGEVV